jgi:hypothetical protein
MLLEERRLSNFERRKRRLKRIPMEVTTCGLLKISRDRGEPLTLEEYISTHAGFLPCEWEPLPSSQEYLERLRLESLRRSARPEPAPAPLAAIEAAPDHAGALSPAPTFAAPPPPPKTESDAWRARLYQGAGDEFAWMA